VDFSILMLVFFLNYIITLFLAKKFVSKNEKLSIPILFKGAVLGGLMGTFAFLFLNATISKPLPTETYKIKSVWKEYESDNGRVVFKGFVADLEGDAYQDNKLFRRFSFDPGTKHIHLDFDEGFFGIKVFRDKTVEDNESVLTP
jgi:hypothetical protein